MSHAAAGFVGSATFGYTISDGSATATANVTVTVTQAVCAEVLTPGTQRQYNAALNRWLVNGTSSCAEGQTVTVTLQATNAVVGTAVVQPNGSWSISTTSGPVVTTGGNIVMTSTLGGSRTAAYNFRLN